MGRALWDTGYTAYIEAAFSAATGDSGVWDTGVWGDAYATLTGASGTYVSTPDDGDYTGSGTIRWMAKLTLADWTPSANMTVASHYTDSTQRGWLIRINTSGQLVFNLSSDGSATTVSQASSALSITDGATYWVGVQYVCSTGALTFYKAGPSITPGSDFTGWTTVSSHSPAAATPFNSNAPLELGSWNFGGSSRLTGSIHQFKMVSGGSVVAEFHPALDADSGDTSFASSTTGETWTLNGAAALTFTGATWGPDLVWSDITSDARAWTSTLGRNREDGHFTAAKGAVTIDNETGDYTPENLSGPYVTGGVTGIRPGRPIRGYVVNDTTGTRYPLFYGKIEDWDENVTSKAPKITFVWVDGIADLADAEGYEQTATGAGDLAGARIHRILNNAEWDGDRNIDVGLATMQATTLAQDAWSETLLTADSEGGEVWVDPDNTLIFQDREAPFRNTRSNTVQWTFTDDPAAVDPYHYEDLKLATGMDVIKNQAALTRAGGTLQTFTNEVSRALYGLRRLGRNDLICESDSDIDALAQTIVTRRSDPSRRPRAITLRPKINTALWPVVFALQLRDRVEVTRQHERSGVTITHECVVDGISHQVLDNDWVTVVSLASTVGLPGADEFGVWDTSLWDAAYWGPST